jgi:HTH-type transcriptional regulator/antitoxin MqsA
MKCPECGAAELKPMRRDLPHTYKDHITIIPNVSGHECPVCDEILVSMEDGKRVSDAMLAFNREVNAMLGDPDFIAGVRKKLNLNQSEAGEIFGGGVNAFSRYETGTTKPPLALVKLFKVLDRHPELLNEIRE